MEPVQELPPQRHVIDLVSDEEDCESIDLAEDIEDFGPFFDDAIHASDQIQQDGDNLDDFFAPPRLGSSPHAAHNPIDLTGLDASSDADNPPARSPPARSPQGTAMVMHDDHDLAAGELITAAACLQMVLNVLPDISVDHALSVIYTSTKDDTRTTAECERIIAQLLDEGGYPKEQDEENSRKRKRNEIDSSSDFEGREEDAESPLYHRDA
jgi:TRIAD3 protein (E3 ubiquitin-protein ligase RNF216)